LAGNVPHLKEVRPIRINQALRDLFEGRSNAVGSVTLATSAASTVVTAINCELKETLDMYVEDHAQLWMIIGDKQILGAFLISIVPDDGDESFVAVWALGAHDMPAWRVKLLSSLADVEPGAALARRLGSPNKVGSD